MDEQILEGIEELRGKVDAFAARVHPVYVLLGWEWGPLGRVPSEDEIKAALHRLLDDFASQVEKGLVRYDYWCTTGGLLVEYVATGDNLGEFSLAFRMDETVYI